MPTRSSVGDGAGSAAARIAGLYVGTSLLWIWLSDWALVWAGWADDHAFLAGALKGTAFVAVTGLLLYWLVRASVATRFRSESLLRAVVEGTSDAVFVKDRDGRYLLANAAAAAFLGRTVGEVLGRGDEELFDPADAERLIASDRAIMAGGRAVTVEETLTAAGTRRTYHATKAPYRDAGGRVVGLVGISRDVSERMRAEAVLRASEARFRELADAIPQIVWTAGPDGGLTHVNARGAAYSGRPGESLLGLSLDEAVHPDDLPALAEERRTAVASGAARDFEFRLRRADGEYRWHVSRQVPVRAADGTVAAWYGTCTDIDDLKRTETALRETDGRLREAQRIARLGSWSWEPPTDRVWWSDAEFELFGLDRVAVRPSFDAFLSLVHPDDRAVAVARVAAMRAGADEFANDLRVLRPDGTLIWVHSRARATQGAGGALVRVEGTDQDVTARRVAEGEVREARRMLRMVLDAVPHAVFWKDRDGRHLGCNAVLARALGFASPDDVVGRTNFDLPSVTREEAEFFTRKDREVVATGVPQLAIDEPLTLPDGRTIRLETYKLPLVDDDGRAIGVVGMWQDVTARVETDRALRASEERYRRLVEVLPDAVFINAGDRVAYCNPACVRLFGAPGAAALVGRSPLDLFAPEFHDVIRAMRETGKPAPGLYERVLRLDGRTVPVHVVATPITDGGRDAILVCLGDLTEQERAAALLRTVLGSVGDAILTIDDRGRVESANPATERLFGFAEAELVGQNVRALMPEPDRGRHDGYIANYLRTGDAKVIGVGREVEGRRRDGTTFPVELTVTEFRLDGERRFTGVLRDITARKRLEDQFRQAQKMEAVGRLAGGVAHDFNNLLTVINGYCELLLATAPAAGDGAREAVVAIRDAGEQAARLTQQLLAFSRKSILEPKVIDLNELVSESARFLRRLIGEDIILAVVTAPTRVRVRADPSQLEQVILNLAVNARDAMPTGGRLALETMTVAEEEGRPARFACLAVTDTGEGMTEEVRGKIFEPFFTTKGVGKGTGLGLAVVHGVVTQSGGRIEVESAVGVGTTFRLLLPLVAAEEAGPAAEATPVAARGTETVLLVEDEDAVRTIARLSLEMQGYTVLEAAGGAAAARLAEGHAGTIDLLVSDVVMPEMGGRQLLEAVRRHRPGLRVLFVSGYTDDAVILHGVEEATDAFLQKPFTPLGLARKVREVLDAPAG